MVPVCATHKWMNDCSMGGAEFLRAVRREHKMLADLPTGLYVRAYESRYDSLFRLIEPKKMVRCVHFLTVLSKLSVVTSKLTLCFQSIFRSLMSFCICSSVPDSIFFMQLSSAHAALLLTQRRFSLRLNFPRIIQRSRQG